MRRITLVALLLTLAVLCPAPPQRRSFLTRPPSPTGDLIVQNPELKWPIWSEDGVQVTDVRLRLNGREVGAWYDHDRRKVVYRPHGPLAPGEYRASVSVQLDGRHTTEREWTFRVRPDAVAALPDLDDAQTRSLAALNAVRLAHGLEAVRPCLALHAASQRHADYMARHRRADHAQTAGQPGFLGARPLDRARLFGVDGAVAELVSRTRGGGADVIAGFLAAPYHRVAVLRPGRHTSGSGFNGEYSCLTLSLESVDGDVVSPPDGATRVPTTWDGVESPNPLRVGRLTAPVGTVVSMTLYRRLPVPFTLVESRITCPAGEAVETFANHPGNDPEAEETVFLIPRRPLSPGTRYTAQIVLALSGGGKLSRTWSFTTAP